MAPQMYDPMWLAGTGVVVEGPGDDDLP